MTAKLSKAVMSVENARRIDAYGKGCIWYTKCRHCKQPLRGTIEKMLEHKCGQAS